MKGDQKLDLKSYEAEDMGKENETKLCHKIAFKG